MRDIAGPAGAAGRGRDARGRRRSPGRCCSATSARSSTAATCRWPSGARPRSPWTRPCSASCSAGWSCASCSTRRSWSRPSGGCSGWTARGPCATPRTPSSCCACSAICPRRSARRGAAARSGWPSWTRARRIVAGADRRRGAAGSSPRTRAGSATRWAWRCRSALAQAYLEPVADPIGDLVARYARTHGPFTASACAARFGLGVFVVEQALKRLAATGRVTAGEFTPVQPVAGGRPGSEWCDAEVLRLLRRRSLAALRREIEPVPPAHAGRLPAALAAGRLVRARRGGGERRGTGAAAGRGHPGLGLGAAGAAGPGRRLHARPTSTSCARPARWSGPGTGSIPGGDGWIAFAWAESAPLLLPPPDPDFARRPVHDAVLDALDGGQALFFRQLAELPQLDGVPEARAAGRAVGPGLGRAGVQRHARAGAGPARRRRRAPVPADRAASATAYPVGPAPRCRRAGSPGPSLAAARSGPPTAAGRWYRLPDRDPNPTRRATALAEALLERHGVVTRGAVMAEDAPGGFAAVYPGAGRAGGAGRGPARATSWKGWARPSSRCRARSTGCGRSATSLAETPPDGRPRSGPRRRSVLAATDPANPYGAALPWPERAVDEGEPGTGHRPGRKAGRAGRDRRRRAGDLRGARRPHAAVLSGRSRARWRRRRRRSPDAVRSGALGRAVGRAGRRRDDPRLAAARRAHRGRLPGHPAGPTPAGLTLCIVGRLGIGPAAASLTACAAVPTGRPVPSRSLPSPP